MFGDALSPHLCLLNASDPKLCGCMFTESCCLYNVRDEPVVLLLRDPIENHHLRYLSYN